MKKSILLGLVLLFSIVIKVNAEETSATQTDLQSKIAQYKKQIGELDKKADTLENLITRIDFDIKVTELTIQKARLTIDALADKVENLSKQIEGLDKQVTGSAAIYVFNTDQMYKAMKLNSTPVLRLVNIKKFNQYYLSEKYNQIVSNYVKNVYVNQEVTLSTIKDLKQQQEMLLAQKVELKDEFEAQKIKLNLQQQDKNKLLEATNKDKNYYTNLKQQAESELASLLSAKYVGKKDIKKGDIIGLMGNSGFSTGPHLHFAVHNLKEEDRGKFSYYNDTDPFPYLKQYGWPLEDYRITQGWGKTPFSRIYASGVHNGVDMVSTNKNVQAVNDGVAYFYRNSGGLGNNVRIFHPDGKMTLYLHLQ